MSMLCGFFWRDAKRKNNNKKTTLFPTDMASGHTKFHPSLVKQNKKFAGVVDRSWGKVTNRSTGNSKATACMGKKS